VSSVVFDTLKCPRCGSIEPFPVSTDVIEEVEIVCAACDRVSSIADFQCRQTVPPFLLRALHKNSTA
jgi:hypothetical protein